MIEEGRQDDGVSVVAIVTILLRSRWRIARWMLVGAIIAGALAFFRPARYVASASFVPKGSDTGRSSLASLAGQFGVALPTADPSASPDFYADILKSRVILLPITLDTFAVPEAGRPRAPFLDLFKLREGSLAHRQEEGLKLLKTMITVSTVKATGVVTVSVATPWRSVSLAIANALLGGLNEYNQQVRQSQASAERKFVGSQLDVARGALREAEDRLEAFMAGNKQFGGSPQLALERERLQRDVTLRSSLFTSLSQSFDDARIREIRDMPVISVIEAPWASTDPAPRGRAQIVVLGFLLGGMISAVVVVWGGLIARRRHDSPEIGELLSTVADAKTDVIGRLPWHRTRRA